MKFFRCLGLLERRVDGGDELLLRLGTISIRQMSHVVGNFEHISADHVVNLICVRDGVRGSVVNTRLEASIKETDIHASRLRTLHRRCIASARDVTQSVRPSAVTNGASHGLDTLGLFGFSNCGKSFLTPSFHHARRWNIKASTV